MDRKVRNILIAVGIVILILVIVPFLIPVNQFKPTIEAKASAALGRQVQMGNLSLSLFTGSLSADNLAVADDPKFGQTPFLTAKAVRVGVAMMPLIFSRALNITSVTIKDPQVTLLHNPAGQWNYSSIGGAAANTANNQAAPPQNNSSSELSVEKLSLENGTIVVGYVGNPKRNTYDHVNVEASAISTHSKFPVSVSADLPGGGKFKLDGNAGPLNAADAALTPVDAKLTASSLNLGSTGFIEPNTGLGGLLDLDASLTSAQGQAETKGNAKLSKALFIQGGSPSSVPLVVDFDTKYDLAKQSGALNGTTLKISGANAQVSGTYNNAGENTIVNVKVDGQNMPAKDLAAFLPAVGIRLPNGASIESGTLSENLTMAGPTTNLVTSGTAGIFSVKLAGFDLGSKMSSISAITGLKSGKDLDIEKMTANLRMTRDGLRADNFIAILPAFGQIVGAGTIDAKNNLDFKMAATLKSGIANVANPTGALTSVLGGGSSGCKNGVTVPFKIEGTTADPKFVPDVGGVAAGMLKTQLGCAGSGVTGAKNLNPTNLNPTDATKSLGGLFKKPKP
ncbi:MAG TPA: AsmA family protein [Methylomirabilota bacterium]|jgi:AsmA protein|nr:AsmA family protein [Methylomirabilota bacterium]